MSKLSKHISYILPFFFLIFFLQPCISQNKVDSLLTVLDLHSENEEKVNTFLKLADLLYRKDPTKALVYCQEAYDLAKQLNYLDGIIKARYDQGHLYKNIGELDSATFCTNEYIAIGDSLGDTVQIADGYLLLANIIRRKGETDKAREYYKKCVTIYHHFKDTFGLISSYNGVGITFKYSSDWDSASVYYFKTLKLCKEIGFKSAIGAVLVNLGKVNLELKNFNKAKVYTQESIEYNLKYNKLKDVALAYTNLGMIASEENDLSLALDYFMQALEINEQLENKIGIYNIHINLGNIFEKKGNFSKAIENFTLALNAFKEIDYKTGLISTYMGLASVHAKINQNKLAHAYYDTCLMLTYETGEKKKRGETYESMSNAYLDVGNFEKAYEYLDKFRILDDSIYKIEKEEKIADLTLKYEKEKDSARILFLENENLEKDLDLRTRTNQRNIYLATGLGLFLIVSFFFIFYRHKARKDGIIAEQKIKQLEEEKKLLAARSIVEGQEEERKRIAKELHDGLGVLLSTAKMQFTSIKDKSPENRPLIEKATKLLEQATGDVRKISHNMMPGLLTKFGLFEAVEDLFEQLDETEVLNAGVNITGETKRLAENTEIMLYRVIQEMVNNTLKHAQAKNISINMNLQPEMLNIQYSDDGKGFNVKEKIESKSIGMTSIQSRIKFLEGDVTAESKPNEGVSYYMQIPI